MQTSSSRITGYRESRHHRVMTALVMLGVLIHIAPTPVGGYIHLGDILITSRRSPSGRWSAARRADLARRSPTS